MLKAAALTAATQFGLAACALVHQPQLLLILSACLLLIKACAAVGSEVGGAVSVLCSAPEAERTSANGKFQSGKNLGSLLAPVVGGLLYEKGGFALPFLVGGGLLSLVVVLGWSRMSALPAYASTEAATSSSPSSTSSKRSLLSIPLIRLALAIYSLAGCALFYALPYLQPWLSQAFALSEGKVGLVVGGCNLGVAIGAGLAATLERRAGAPVALAIAFAMAIAGFLLLSASPSHGLWLFLLALALVNGSVGSVFTISNPLMIKAAEGAGMGAEDAAAQAASTGIISLGVAVAIAPACSSLVVGALGYQRATAAAAAIVGLPGLALSLLLAWKMR